MAGKAKAKAKKQENKESTQAGNELLVLWAILGEGGGNDVSRSALEKKGMLQKQDKKARDGLVARGLIKAEERKTRNEQGRSVRGIWMTVTKAGMTWAQENLAAVPAKSQAAAPILQTWLARLSVLLQARQITITEFLEPRRDRVSPEYGISLASPAGALREDLPAVTRHPDPSPLNSDYDALRARIRQAYFAVTGNRINTRARLCDIRQKLNDVDPALLEVALKRMQREQQATLYPLDNKAEITDADRNAAIYFGSEPRHILWIER